MCASDKCVYLAVIANGTRVATLVVLLPGLSFGAFLGSCQKGARRPRHSNDNCFYYQLRVRCARACMSLDSNQEILLPFTRKLTEKGLELVFCHRILIYH
jgi:hypothetical protein